MRALTNLLFKAGLSSMILTAPAMTGNKNDVGSAATKEIMLPYYTEAVIKKFVNYNSFMLPASPSSLANASFTSAPASFVPVTASVAPATVSVATIAVAKASAAVATASAAKEVSALAVTRKIAAPDAIAFSTLTAVSSATASSASAAAKELNMVVNQAAILYDYMDLEDAGLDQKAFEYAWRGYHNLLKKGLIHKKTVLSICDFSQSSNSKRMYVIDVRRKKLLYRTYVAHGQNSGGEYASSFSNEPESFKSSLGFYVTSRTYWGKNGLSLKIEGVDTGYNDLAGKRNIVLHGSTYVSQKYMSDFGSIGTSLGCPAIPKTVSSKVIRAVKNGSCFFIYHPTPVYLEQSTVLNNG